jgi:hypothetical protein
VFSCGLNAVRERIASFVHGDYGGAGRIGNGPVRLLSWTTAAMDDITSTTDRYTTFAGIDCTGNSLRLVQAIRRHIDDPAKTNKFWEAFKVKLAHAELEPVKRKADQLCLLCSHVCYLDELFEEHDDKEGLELLRVLEVECC